VPARDPAERSMIASIASNEYWATVPDRTARTEACRRAANERFERLVDPDGTLPPEERAKRAECARRAHFKRMALKSAQARRKKAA